MMKIAAVAIALVIGSFAFGQTPEERAVRVTNKMVEELSLNDDQTARISEINMGIATKNNNIRTATNIPEEQKPQILSENNAARLRMYEGVLTPDQYAAFGSIVFTAEEQL